MAAMTERRKTDTVRVGDVLIGSQHPIVVQSMTNTDTADVESTVSQIRKLFEVLSAEPGVSLSRAGK